MQLEQVQKQCNNERDAQPIAYGGMLLEGFLAILVIIACGAGIGLGFNDQTELLKEDAFQALYSSWQSLEGLGSKLTAFVTGASNIISIGIPPTYSVALMGLFVAAFAATTLDTATRLQRYIVSEIAMNLKSTKLSQKHPATLIAVLSALLLAFCSDGGKRCITSLALLAL